MERKGPRILGCQATTLHGARPYGDARNTIELSKLRVSMRSGEEPKLHQRLDSLTILKHLSFKPNIDTDCLKPRVASAARLCDSFEVPR